MLKKKALLLSVSYTITLTIVSLVKLDLDNVEEIIPSFSDKIFHFLAYIQSIIRSVIVSALFGIIIEVLQLLITTSRSFDVKDILANLLGILIAAILINNCIKIEVKKY